MSVARNTLVQSSLTLASRVLGMVRDILLVATIGAGPVGDAWATAQQFPNLFRRIFAEGAFCGDSGADNTCADFHALGPAAYPWRTGRRPGTL